MYGVETCRVLHKPSSLTDGVDIEDSSVCGSGGGGSNSTIDDEALSISTCPGGPWNATCLGGFSGVMCGICDMGDGAVPTRFRDSSGSCAPCDKLGIAWLQLAGGCAAIPMVAFLLLKVHMPSAVNLHACPGMASQLHVDVARAFTIPWH